MTDETRDKLLDLWKLVPETRPNDGDGSDLIYDEQWCWQEGDDGCVIPFHDKDGGDFVAAIFARDAMLEWLHSKIQGRIEMESLSHENSVVLWHVYFEIGWNCHDVTGPNRTLALVAACLVVAGKGTQ